MAVLPGWIILREAAMTLIRADFAAIGETKTEELVAAFVEQIQTHPAEPLPEARVPELLELVGDAVVLVFFQWPGWILQFFICHGGESAITNFLARHPTWQSGTCSCCGERNIFDSEAPDPRQLDPN